MNQPPRLSHHLVPAGLLALAAALLFTSIFLPYWRLTLLAPQYPGGLSVQTYVNRIEGDVQEIDGLYHYIGMRPLEQAAQFERAVSVYAITALALIVVAAIFVNARWSWLLTLPTLMLPAVFLLDLYVWLQHFGLHLDPTAPLSSSVKPFVPAVLGRSKIAQFETVAAVDSGFYLALVAAALVLVSLLLYRLVYRRRSATRCAATRGLGEPLPDRRRLHST